MRSSIKDFIWIVFENHLYHKWHHCSRIAMLSQFPVFPQMWDHHIKEKNFFCLVLSSSSVSLFGSDVMTSQTVKKYECSVCEVTLIAFWMKLQNGFASCFVKRAKKIRVRTKRKMSGSSWDGTRQHCDSTNMILFNYRPTIINSWCRE